MALFLSLYLGHLLADFALQPGALVRAKREGLPGVLLHVALIGIATTAVLWSDTPARWWVVLLAMATHFGIERLTIAARIGTPTRGLFVFLFDQAMHMVSIAVLVGFAGEWTFGGEARLFWMLVSENTIAVVDGILTVTLFGSILAFEAAGAFVGDPSYDTVILSWDLGRVLGVAERGGSLALALLAPAGLSALGLSAPAPAIVSVAIVLPFVPRFVYAATRKEPPAREWSYVEGISGLAVCILCYLAIATIAVLAGQ